jgi:uncharacterized membrane protein YedE/YeeE
MTVAAIASLLVGVVIGYVGQRSRMCFIGGIRDWILVRDTFLLKGLVAFVVVGWVLFPLAPLAGGASLGAFSFPVGTAALLAAVGGLGVGVVSVWAEGCPFRQHVLAAQGSMNAVAYLGGFLAGAVAFHALIAPLLGSLVL